MSNLDNAIKDVAYILDSLMALRNIYQTGSCNECEAVKTCEYAPKPGQMVRYNCPFYQDAGAEADPPRDITARSTRTQELRPTRPGLTVEL